MRFQILIPTLTSFAFSLIPALAPAAAHAAVVDFVSAPLTQHVRSFSTTQAGVTVNVFAYHAEFIDDAWRIFGPVTTGTVGGYQNFGTCTSGFCGNGFGMTIMETLGQFERDKYFANYEPGFESGSLATSNPTLQFAVFEFDQFVDVSQVFNSGVSGGLRGIWAAGGTNAPDLEAGLEAFDLYTVVNSPDTGGIPVETHNLAGLNGIRFLVVGSPLSVDVGLHGAIGVAAISNFYIRGINLTPVPEPGLGTMLAAGLALLTLVSSRARIGHPPM